jgi:thiosulfate reductase cytochrome b subunit
MALYYEKHKLLNRFTHWVNFPTIGIMVWSGLLIYWANDIYSIKIGNSVLFRFFPASWYDALGMARHLSIGMNWHFVFMWLFMLNGLIYVAYTLFTGSWREFNPGKGAIKNAFLVVLHDLGLRKTAPEQGKYNAAQQMVYAAIIIMGIGSLLTGWAIYKPVQVNWLTWLMGGYETARLIHFSLTIGYMLFFLIHILQVVKAGWRNFFSMVSGIERINTSHEKA